MVNQILAVHRKWSYLDPAWVMTIGMVESGLRPLVVNATGRQDGIMQVTPPTAVDMASIYGIPVGPQTDPMTSFLSGIATLDDYARGYIKAWNTVSLDLWTLAKSYNGGLKNLLPNPEPPPSSAWLAAVARYLVKFEAELPIMEQQMAATALLTNKPSFAPRRMRAVMPLSVAV
jgi:soluble lytic murein transglycosylase-like protein